MNLFYLDSDPAQCARWHVDSHVVKMPLEAAQLLSTAHNILGTGIQGYKSTHINHPCAKWVRATRDNYEWTLHYGWELCKEYTYRYHRKHKSQAIIEALRFIPDLPRGMTKPALAMPQEYKTTCPIQSYRNYYTKGKADLHKWKSREVPSWMN